MHLSPPDSHVLAHTHPRALLPAATERELPAERETRARARAADRRAAAGRVRVRGSARAAREPGRSRARVRGGAARYVRMPLLPRAPAALGNTCLFFFFERFMFVHGPGP